MPLLREVSRSISLPNIMDTEGIGRLATRRKLPAKSFCAERLANPMASGLFGAF
jgi:hypothetical protein